MQGGLLSEAQLGAFYALALEPAEMRCATCGWPWTGEEHHCSTPLEPDRVVTVDPPTAKGV